MKDSSNTVSALEALRLRGPHGLALLDVRAPGEFAKGHFPGSVNGPILTDDERHQVGLTYKQRGQPAAIALGHELVDPVRPERVAGWQRTLGNLGTSLVACWRGGLRSGTACAWLAEAGTRALRVEGGYKGIRHHLLAELEKPREGIVIAGTTGSGKTEFLQSLRAPNAIDLEALASHRGSSFGGLFTAAQPAQQTFENALGLKLLDVGPKPLVLEDESRLVGRCVVPEAFFESMRTMPRVVLERSQEERVQALKLDYVDEPLRALDAAEVHARLDRALAALRNRLGGADTQSILGLLHAAFRGEGSHEAWIEALLTRYYDPLYTHSMERSPGPVLFRGDAKALREWLALKGYL